MMYLHVRKMYVCLDPFTPASCFSPFRQDAAHALLGGLAVSSANQSNGHHHHQQHNGVARTGEGLQKARGGVGGVQDAPNTPGSNRKGHDEEQTLLSGVGNLMTRARRGVNSYFSAVARQQKEIARETRHRKKSSNFDFLVDAEEGVGLLSIAAAEDGLKNGVGTNGGPLHRSQSDVFVPSRPEEEQADTADPATMVSETRSSGMAADPGELRDVSEAAAFLQAVEESYGGAGGRRMEVERTMKRGRARLTTGDLTRLYREEEQGAGEDSAQDEDRERSGASKVSSVVICRR